MPGFLTHPNILLLDGREIRLQVDPAGGPLRYRINGEIVTVPPGYISDGASVPRFYWWRYPPIGLYTRPAIVHDFLYEQGRYSRARCDRVFAEAMEEAGVDAWTRRLFYYQLRLWGWGAWNRHRARQREQDREAA